MSLWSGNISEDTRSLVRAILEEDEAACEACLNKLAPVGSVKRDVVWATISDLVKRRGQSPEHEAAVDEAFGRLASRCSIFVTIFLLLMSERSGGLLMVALSRFPELVKNHAACLLSQQNSVYVPYTLLPSQAISLVNRLVECCPPRSALEVLAYVLRNTRWQPRGVKQEILRHLGELARKCPEGAAVVVERVVVECGNPAVEIRMEAMRQVASCVAANPPNLYALLKRVHDVCGDERDQNVRCEAIRLLPQLIKAVPKHTRAFVCRLLWCCGENQAVVNTSARNALKKIVRTYPEAALETLVALKATKEPQGGTTSSCSEKAEEKRSNDAIEEPHPTQRRQMNEEVTPRPSSSDGSQSAAEQRNSRRKTPPEGVEEQSRPSQRRKTHKDDVNVASESLS